MGLARLVPRASSPAPTDDPSTPRPPGDVFGPGEGPIGHAPASAWQQLRARFIGGARDPLDPHVFHQISLVAFLAWVGLGADGLSSSC